MSDDGPEEQAGQLASILLAIAEINDKLDAMEWRRKCLWVFPDIVRSAENLKSRLPREEHTFKKILERVDSYANLVFESAQDLQTAYTCFILIAEILEEAEKAETLSFMDIWREIHPLLDDLETLDSGDPPLVSNSELRMRAVKPELRDAERANVRERFNQRWETSVDKSLARDMAEDEEFYG
jgi:hypothetical protein